MKEFLLIKYKEPLREVKKGFGYEGVLSMDAKGEVVQCHICGEVFPNLSQHIKVHALTVLEYRKEFKLAASTSLLSEVERERLKQNGLHTWQMKSKAEQAKFVALGKKGNKKRFTHTLETKNKRGVCPDQLLKKILDVKTTLGYTPSLREFRREMNKQRIGGVVAMLYKTFGSWNNALKKAKLTVNPKQNTTRWSDKELLNHLKSFWLKNKTIPTKSDAKRGYIPSIEMYRHHFGGIVRARELAGIK